MRSLLPLVLLACQGPTSATPSSMPASVPAATPMPSALDLPADTVIASWGGGTITAKELDDRVGNELRNRRVRFLLDQYDRQNEALEVLVTERLIADEVKRRGLSTSQELIRLEVEDKVPDPTEEEIAAFFPILQPQLRNATLDEARPIVVSELIRRARERRYDAFMAELRTKASLDLRLPYPDVPRADVPILPEDPRRGSEDAEVVIVQYAEYQCYWCGRVEPTLDRLLEEYDGKVRLVWKDYPLSNHGRAIPAAVAARCAGEQDNYWQMNRLLLANQHALSDAAINGYARQLGLDAPSFQECIGSGKYERVVAQNMKKGEELGVQFTPTFYINGVLLTGAAPYQRFKTVIDRELASRSTGG